MRNIAWIAVGVVLMTDSLAQAQGQGYYPPQPMWYGNPAAYGQAAPAFRPQMPMGMPYAPPGMPYQYYAPAAPPGWQQPPGGNGTSKWAWSDPVFKPYEDFVMPVQAVAPPQEADPRRMRSQAAIGNERMPPPSMPGEEVGCIPPMAMPNPLDPLPPRSRSAERALQEQYRIDRDEGGMREPVLLGWVLNTLWRLNFDTAPEVPYRTWVGAEYLRMRIKSAPVPVPLVTGNNDPVNNIGALGEPGTTVLFGAGSGQSTNFDAASGVRFTAGWWLGSRAPVALELSAFMLNSRRIVFDATSDGGDAPLVSVPFFATQPFNFINPAGETALNAGGAPNQVNVTLTSKLWGAEVNFIIDPHPESTIPLRVMPTIGYRYLDLMENLALTDTFFDVAGGGTVTVADSFGTRNQFYGAQVGLRTFWSLSRWSLDSNVRIALGTNHQTLNVAGSTTVENAAFGLPTGITPGGVFAQSSNIGSFHRNVFAFLPEGLLKLAYELTQSIRLFAGYQFLYLNNAVRPGNQLDRNINPTQNALFNAGANIVGPLSPLPVFRSTDFWAQGINVGFELRF